MHSLCKYKHESEAGKIFSMHLATVNTPNKNPWMQKNAFWGWMKMEKSWGSRWSGCCIDGTSLKESICREPKAAQTCEDYVWNNELQWETILLSWFQAVNNEKIKGSSKKQYKMIIGTEVNERPIGKYAEKREFRCQEKVRWSLFFCQNENRHDEGIRFKRRSLRNACMTCMYDLHLILLTTCILKHKAFQRDCTVLCLSFKNIIKNTEGPANERSKPFYWEMLRWLE